MSDLKIMLSLLLFAFVLMATLMGVSHWLSKNVSDFWLGIGFLVFILMGCSCAAASQLQRGEQRCKNAERHEEQMKKLDSEHQARMAEIKTR